MPAEPPPAAIPTRTLGGTSCPIRGRHGRHFVATGSKLPRVAAPKQVPLAGLGIGPRGDRLYRVVLRDRQLSLDELADRLGWPVSDVTSELEPLTELELLTVDDGKVSAISPHRSLGRLVEQEARDLAEHERRIDLLRASIRDYAAEERAEDMRHEGIHPLEVHIGGTVGPVVDALIRGTSGPLLLTHPIEWLDHPGWGRADTLLPREISGGRPARGIYPSEALHRPDALRIVRDHASVGEQVRLMPRPPSRLIVFGADAALVPIEWNGSPARRVVVRTSGVVQAMVLLFDLLWQQAVPLPSADAGKEPRDLTTEILRLLTAGAKDETIARQLSLSVRTVRRRIADVMLDLGATTRFQAGAEAVRRTLR